MSDKNKNKTEWVSSIHTVYDIMMRDRLKKGLESWPLDEYRDVLIMLSRDDWTSFGPSHLEKVRYVISHYFGRSEIVSNYCPKLISYEENIAAQRALEAIVDLIRSQSQNV